MASRRPSIGWARRPPAAAACQISDVAPAGRSNRVDARATAPGQLVLTPDRLGARHPFEFAFRMMAIRNAGEVSQLGAGRQGDRTVSLRGTGRCLDLSGPSAQNYDAMAPTRGAPSATAVNIRVASCEEIGALNRKPCISLQSSLRRISS